METEREPLDVFVVGPTAVHAGLRPVVRLVDDKIVSMSALAEWPAGGRSLITLADLEKEHAAGDVDDLDYRTLKDGYTVRAATVLREIDVQAERAQRSKELRDAGHSESEAWGTACSEYPLPSSTDA